MRVGKARLHRGTSTTTRCLPITPALADKPTLPHPSSHQPPALHTSRRRIAVVAARGRLELCIPRNYTHPVPAPYSPSFTTSARNRHQRQFRDKCHCKASIIGCVGFKDNACAISDPEPCDATRMTSSDTSALHCARDRVSASGLLPLPLLLPFFMPRGYRPSSGRVATPEE